MGIFFFLFYIFHVNRIHNTLRAIDVRDVTPTFTVHSAEFNLSVDVEHERLVVYLRITQGTSVIYLRHSSMYNRTYQVLVTLFPLLYITEELNAR